MGVVATGVWEKETQKQVSFLLDVPVYGCYLSKTRKSRILEAKVLMSRLSEQMELSNSLFRNSSNYTM